MQSDFIYLFLMNMDVCDLCGQLDWKPTCI